MSSRRPYGKRLCFRLGWRVAGGLFALPLLSACATLVYYAQAVDGQRRVLGARMPLADVIVDPQTPPAQRAQFLAALQARDWASRELHLPDNGSYRSYVALPGPYVVWNVLATPEFSLEPVEHCFMLVGCLAYQGYFSEAAAQARAATLAAQQLDTAVVGVPAYSTLGWFDDPLLSTMLGDDAAALAALIFHELAHQQVFVDGDTRFNESYAEFVASEGLRQYLAVHPELSDAAREQRRQRHAQFTQLVLDTREALDALYRQPLPADVMRARKAALLDALRRRYQLLRDTQWQHEGGFDRWLAAAPLNNARLLPFGLYEQDLPAFARLFAEHGHDWQRFHQAVRQLGRRSAGERAAELQRLREAAAGP